LQSYGSKLCKPMGKVTSVFNHNVAVSAILCEKSHGGPWRQLHCLGCHGYFPEHHGTILHGKRVTVELLVRVLACLAEGLGMRATARVFEVDPNTVLHWLVEVADQLQTFSRYFLCDVHVRQVQLDELYTVLRAVKTVS